MPGLKLRPYSIFVNLSSQKHRPFLFCKKQNSVFQLLFICTVFIRRFWESRPPELGMASATTKNIMNGPICKSTVVYKFHKGSRRAPTFDQVSWPTVNFTTALWIASKQVFSKLGRQTTEWKCAFGNFSPSFILSQCMLLAVKQGLSRPEMIF